MRRSWMIVVACVAFLAGCGGLEPITLAPELPALSPTQRATVELGRDLFFDSQLSGDGTVSCATCHVPEQAGAENAQVSTGINGQLTRRNSPTVFNVGLKELFFWDGRAGSLEEQALMPLFDPGEMGANEADVLAYLATHRAQFDAAFPGRSDSVTLPNLAKALAEYQRHLLAPSRVDEYLRDDVTALDTREVSGMERFEDMCASCHDGPGFGGRDFRRLGEEEEWPPDRRDDLGLFEITGDDSDRMVFVVPILRNVARTAPYFHDGSVPTLEEAVRLMGRHQVGEQLSDVAVAELVAFLNALDGDPRSELLQPTGGDR